MDLDRLLKILSETKTSNNKELEKMYRLVMANIDDDVVVENLLDDILEIKREQLDKFDERNKARARDIAHVIVMSQYLDELISKETIRLKMSDHDFVLKVFADYFGIPLEQCDSRYWRNKLAKELNQQRLEKNARKKSQKK